MRCVEQGSLEGSSLHPLSPEAFQCRVGQPPKAGTSKHKMIVPNPDVISVFLTGPGDNYLRLRHLAVGLQEASADLAVGF